MIDEIRTYFKSVISEVDSDLKQHNQYFTSENIADSNLEDRYFIQFGALSTERQDTDMVGSVAVSLFIWKNGYNDIIENLDTAYCNAIEIQAKLMNQANVDQTEFIKSVVGNSITPEAVTDNDNLARFSLEFTVTTGYKSF